MPVAVAMGSDTRKVHALLTDICDDQPAVMIDPPPSVGFVGFAGGALNFEIRVILSDTNLKGDVQTEINHQIRERFAAEGIEFPQPQRDIFVRNAEAFGRALAPDAQPARPQRPARRRTTVDPDRISNDPNEGEDPDRI
jgi:small-conductance mechanosensitive channel